MFGSIYVTIFDAEKRNAAKFLGPPPEILKMANEEFKINITKGNVLEEDFTPKDKKDLLALQLAEALNDEKNLGLYLSYCRKYPKEIITRAFIAAKELPIEKVKRSRGALFTYLVKKYAQQKENEDFGD